MMNRTAKTVPAAAALALTVLILTGCATGQAAAEAPTVAPRTTTPVAMPTPTVEPVVEEPLQTYITCDAAPKLIPADHVEGTMNGLEPTLLGDSGPRAQAQGESVLNENGEPVAYVAAEGDTINGIAQRFCVGANPTYLEMLNSIRRTGLYSSEGQQRAVVYAGDTINLNPYTIASVGDEAGAVHDFSPSFTIPPQR
ncbi:hypothetical protein [Microbacterium profundi]|uniref:hypothetical protein n=1 Tax=Microbacterium profundi TaxID=450380 RepID=UPI001F29ACA4|nr:hypothetical protein [Microbacterium profundi]MCE7481908.1 hypothetical protein [Microbacterium profundi]